MNKAETIVILLGRCRPRNMVASGLRISANYPYGSHMSTFKPAVIHYTSARSCFKSAYKGTLLGVQFSMRANACVSYVGVNIKSMDSCATVATNEGAIMIRSTSLKYFWRDMLSEYTFKSVGIYSTRNVMLCARALSKISQIIT